MPTKTKPMTEGAPWLHVLKFSLPVLAGSTMQQLYNTVDAIVVGNYSGEDALAAVGTTGSFIFLLHAIAIGLSAGTGVVVAQFYGANDQRQVRANAASGASFLLTLGAILTILGIAVSRPAFDAFVGVPDDFLEQTLLYFRLYCVGLVFQFGYWSFSSILRGVGDSAATLYFLLISSILNIALDVLFVAYFKWGVAGAAIATDVAEGVAFFAAFFYMVRRYPVFRFRLEDYRWNAAAIMRTVRVGAPISAQLLVVAFGFTLIQRAVNDFGQAMTAAFTVGQRIDMYLSLPGHAFQTTLATFAGQNIGANKLERARQGAMQTLLIALAMAIAISIFVFSFPTKSRRSSGSATKRRNIPAPISAPPRSRISCSRRTFPFLDSIRRRTTARFRWSSRPARSRCERSSSISSATVPSWDIPSSGGTAPSALASALP